jgi:hypothetical protein
MSHPGWKEARTMFGAGHQLIDISTPRGAGVLPSETWLRVRHSAQMQSLADTHSASSTDKVFLH